MPVLHAIPIEEKAQLIRNLLEMSFKKGSLLRRIAGSFEMFNPATMSLTELMGMPEAAIVTIAESYFRMQSMGVPDAEIFAAIEAHRSTVQPGKKQPPQTLIAYAQYRVDLEHGARHLGLEQVDMITTTTGNFMRQFCVEQEPPSSTQIQIGDVSPYFRGEKGQFPHPDYSRPLGMRTLHPGIVLSIPSIPWKKCRPARRKFRQVRLALTLRPSFLIPTTADRSGCALSNLVARCANSGVPER